MPAESRSRDHERLHAAGGSDAVRVAIAALRTRGERVTAPRRAVLDVLAHHADHLTAEEVAVLLADTDVHRATVYRTLELLAASGVVSHRQTPGGAARYHLAAAGGGREHLHGHCRRCSEVVVLPPDTLDGVGARVRAAAGFRLDVRQTTLVGLCERCARLGPALQNTQPGGPGPRP